MAILGDLKIEYKQKADSLSTSETRDKCGV